MGFRVGTSGWVYAPWRGRFYPQELAQRRWLGHYASVFVCVEVNGSFYRLPEEATFRRWAESVPDGFRFAVKFPRAGTHDARLQEAEPIIESFASQVHELGDRLGPVLVQLPPSLAFERDVADVFFDAMRQHFDGPIVCEPRHPTWFTPAGDALWKRFHVARVAADPARVPEAAIAGGAGPVRYWRLHGAPRVYYDAYGEEGLRPWADDIRAAREAGLDCWVVMDNTALGHATLDAMRLEAMLADMR